VGPLQLSFAPLAQTSSYATGHGSAELAALLNDNGFHLKDWCLADIFSVVNKLSRSMQGKNKSQIEATEKVSAFEKKLFPFP